MKTLFTSVRSLTIRLLVLAYGLCLLACHSLVITPQELPKSDIDPEKDWVHIRREQPVPGCAKKAILLPNETEAQPTSQPTNAPLEPISSPGLVIYGKP